MKELFFNIAVENEYIVNTKAHLEAAFRHAGFVNYRTERNDRVKFGAHCILGEKPIIK